MGARPKLRYKSSNSIRVRVTSDDQVHNHEVEEVSSVMAELSVREKSCGGLCMS